MAEQPDAVTAVTCEWIRDDEGVWCHMQFDADEGANMTCKRCEHEDHTGKVCHCLCRHPWPQIPA